MFKVNRKLSILLGLVLVLTIVPIVLANTAILTTDKDIYEPGDTVLIMGQGFNSNSEILISITKPDPDTGMPAGEVVTDKVYSDANGNFNFSYFLIDSLFGDYKVEATDGINTAVTTFFDPPKVDMVDEPLTTEGNENTVYWLRDGEPSKYEVQAALDDKFENLLIAAIVEHPSQEYTVSGLEIGNIYYYRVRALNPQEKPGKWSNTVFSQQIAPPDITPPTAPVVTGVENGQTYPAAVTPVWESVDGTTTGATLNGQPYTNGTAITADGDYTLVVTATKLSNNKTATTTISFTIKTPPPADTTPPTAPTGLSLTANISEVTVNWKANTESDVAGYKLHYGTNSSGYKVIDVGNVTSYKITGLSPMASYTFAISAYDNATNASNMSNTLAVENPNPTIIEVNKPGYTFTGNWLNSTYATFQGRLCKYTKVVGSSVTYQFSGTGISWLATKSAWGAIGKVYIDDVYVASVDTYNPTNLYQQVVFSKNGLSQGSHKIKIVFTGEKNPAASQSGLSLDVDALKVW